MEDQANWRIDKLRARQGWQAGILILGHLGRDVYLRIPERPTLNHQQQELEAESTAFIVCARNGVECKSESYLASYVKQDTSTEQLDLYQIMRAAGHVKTILGLAARTEVDRPKKKGNELCPCFLKMRPNPPTFLKQATSEASVH